METTQKNWDIPVAQLTKLVIHRGYTPEQMREFTPSTWRVVIQDIEYKDYEFGLTPEMLEQIIADVALLTQQPATGTNAQTVWIVIGHELDDLTTWATQQLAAQECDRLRATNDNPAAMFVGRYVLTEARGS